MERFPRPLILRYAMAVVAVTAALAVTITLRPWLTQTPFAFFYIAVLLSAWYGGPGPALLSILASVATSAYFLFPPSNTFALATEDLISAGVFALVSSFIALITVLRERLAVQAHAQREQLAVTLASIGDAVIVTDRMGIVTFLNGTAANLTGWSEKEAQGQPLTSVFVTVDEQTRVPTENPVERVLRERSTVGLKNHTLLIAKSGQAVAIDDSAAPIRNALGQVIGVVLVFRNIEERRQAERALRDSEERFRSLIENSSDGIALLDAEGTIRYASASNSRVLGYPPEDLLGKNAFDFLAPEDRDSLRAVLQEIVSNAGTAPFGQFRFRTHDGGYRWMEGTAANLLREPTVRGIVVNYRDITERKEASEALQESRDQLQVILRGVTEGITVQAPDGRLVYANDVAARILGFQSGSELLDVPGEEISRRFEIRDEAGDPIGMGQLPSREALKGIQPAPVLVRFRPLPDGAERWSLVEATPVSDPQGRLQFVINIFRDITDRIQTERRQTMQYSITRILADSSTLDEAAPHLIRAIGENLDWEAGSFWAIDAERGKLRYVDGWHASRIQVDEFEGLSRRTAFAEGVGFPGRVWSERGPVWIEEYDQSRFLRAPVAAKAGIVSAFGVPILLGSEFVGVIEFFTERRRARDTELSDLLVAVGGQIAQFVERKRAEDALRLSEERMRTIADTASDGIITVDSDSRILFHNRAIGEMFGYASDELVGKSLTLLMPRDQREKHFASVKRYIHTNERRLDWREVEIQGRRKDGSSMPLEVSIGEFVKDGKHYFTGVLRDVSERHATEERLRFQASILENVTESVITVDLTGKVTFWNKGAEAVFGYASEEMMGRGLEVIYPDMDPDRLAKDLQDILQGQDFSGEWQGRTKDGREIWVDVRSKAMRDAAGRVSGFLGIAKDITATRGTMQALRSSEERFRSLSSNSPVGIFLADIEGRITYINPRLQAIGGMASDGSALGEGWLQYVEPEDTARVEQEWQAYTHEGARYDTEFRLKQPNGETRWVHARSSPMFSDEGQLLGHVATVEDVTERKRANTNLRFLAEASSVLSSSLDYEQTLSSVARLAVPDLADWCVIDMLGEDGQLHALELAHVNPEMVRWAAELREQYPVDMNAPLGAPNVVRTRKAELYSDITDEMLRAAAHNEEEYQLLTTVGYRSLMVVPLVARDRALGAISFVLTQPARRYGPNDLSLAEELARRAAVAVDNARLYQAEQSAREAAERASDLTTRLQQVTAALSSALTPEQVASIVVNQGVAALGADAGLMAVLNESDRRIQVVRTVGYPTEMVEAWRETTIDSPLILTEAMRTRSSVWVDSAEALQERYPTSPYKDLRVPFQSHAAVPLIVENRVLGGIGLSFAAERRIPDSDRDFFLTLAQQSAQALERARLFQAEERAHREAETTRERIAFLSEASRRLSGSLDPEQVLSDLASLAVPALADWATVDIIGTDGDTRMAARAHADLDKVLLIDELRERFPLANDAPYGYPQVIRTGEPSFVPAPTPLDVQSITKEEAHRDIIRRLGFTSHICVPLAARGRTFGAITLNLSQPGRCFTPDDLALALEFGRRGAVAYDNARLYRETQEAVGVRDQFLSIASHELKTPLTSLLGYTELLKRDTAQNKTLSERDQRALAVIASQAIRLTKLINSMLDVARIENGQLAIDRVDVDLVELTGRVVDNMRLVADRHRIEYQPPRESITVNGDDLRLEQVLENLIQNAIKYSPEGGVVRVGLGRIGREVCLSITDQGIGIPERELSRLFSRFYRVESGATRHISGMGVGLYVVQEVVKEHGGRVVVESQEGVGSTFSVYLPVSERVPVAGVP